MKNLSELEIISRIVRGVMMDRVLKICFCEDIIWINSKEEVVCSVQDISNNEINLFVLNVVIIDSPG